MATAIPDDTEARLSTRRDADGRVRVALTGDWKLGRILPRFAELERALRACGREPNAHWDLRAAILDDAAALLLMDAWHGQRPPGLALGPEQATLLSALERAPTPQTRSRPRRLTEPLVYLGYTLFALIAQLHAIVVLVGHVLIEALGLLAHPARIPWREISANVFRTGAQALPITALVGFLVGIVLSYLSALELKLYGADVYIINVVGIGVIRELGPLLAAILVAGRSGSSMTAQLGVMRVTQELDALSVMGISPTQRLVLPKVLALALTMPLLILWTDAVALVGGGFAAQRQLNITLVQFLRGLPSVVPLANLWIGLGKGIAFGALIALVACHYGLQVKPNTESLGRGTTSSVVTAITLVIIVDAIVAVLFSNVGYY